VGDGLTEEAVAAQHTRAQIFSVFGRQSPLPPGSVTAAHRAWGWRSHEDVAALHFANMSLRSLMAF